jgi:hypothetical protein
MARLLCCSLLLAAGVVTRADAGLRCVPPAVDLGEVRGGPARQHRFDLVNDGPTAIEILNIERGCGCLTPRLDRKVLQPGEKATLQVEVRTAGQANGPRSWNLRLRYRDGDALREELIVIAATIRNEVSLQPTILALHVRDVLRQEVVVTDLRSSPLKVTSLHASSPAIRAKVKSVNGGVTKLELEVSAAALNAGTHDAMLTVYTDDPQYGALSLPITLTRENSAPVTASPAQVEARVSPAQPVAAALVRLRRADGGKIVVQSATADDPGVTCTCAAGPGVAATLKVQVDARRLTDRAGPRNVRVQLAEPAGQIVIVPVSANVGQ